MTRYGLLIALLVCPGPWSWAGEKPRSPSAQQIKALVAQLVSPNPKPILKGDSWRLPKGFDRDKQKKVHEAWAELRMIGPSAFPFLIENLDDDRYCMTVEISAGDNLTVGQVCFEIIFEQIQPYGFRQKGVSDPRTLLPRPSYPEFLRSKKEARKWWEKSKHKTLYQMQLEALDWVIAEEAKRPRDFIDAEKKYLQQLRKKLVKSGKAMSVPAFGSIFGKPSLDPPR